MDATRDFVAGRHGYSVVAVGGAHERTAGMNGTLRAVDNVMGKHTFVGGNAMAEGREKSSTNSSREGEKSSMRQDLQFVGAWNKTTTSSTSTS